MRVVLEGTKSNGETFRKEVAIDIAKLSLWNSHLSSLDLSPLRSCQELRSLDLRSNQFVSMDLSPLSSCLNFEWLNLAENQLASIDLSPLKSCLNLQRLNLNENQLASIDLSPLQNCQELWEFGLDSNVSIVWRSAQLDFKGLPAGLKEYSEKIQQAWAQFIREQKG